MTITYLLGGFAALVAALWAPLSLVPLGSYNSRMNRQIRDFERPHPEEVRNNKLVVGQFVPMSVVTLIAGTLAGISASLFVYDGHLRWPSSQVPLALFGFAIFVAEFGGIAIASYVSRPTQSWVEDSSVFRSWLRRMRARGWIEESELAQIRKIQSKWAATSKAWPLRNPHELRQLGLELLIAREEWASPIQPDPVQFGARLSADMDAGQVWCWIRHKRLWRLGIPPVISGLALAGIIRGLIRLTGLSLSLSVLLSVPIAFGCVALLYWLAFRIGRLDLVMTNRYLALERKQLDDCDQLIDIIQRCRDEQVNASPIYGPQRMLVVRIGRWELCRLAVETPHPLTPDSTRLAVKDRLKARNRSPEEAQGRTVRGQTSWR
jgi:hypothetical protein